jgi:hypothetical protein
MTNARDWARNLEATYLVRLFAVFEQALRDYWSKSLKRTTHPKTEDLINSIAARRRVHYQELQAVHHVRAFRNAVVH